MKGDKTCYRVRDWVWVRMRGWVKVRFWVMTLGEGEVSGLWCRVWAMGHGVKGSERVTGLGWE